MNFEDFISIHQLIGSYGHLVDGRRWDLMEEVFAEDVTFDSTAIAVGAVSVGRDTLLERWKNTPHHPLAHHATNLVIDSISGDTAAVRWKGIGVKDDGRVHSTEYRVSLRQTDRGWRIAHLIASHR